MIDCFTHKNNSNSYLWVAILFQYYKAEENMFGTEYGGILGLLVLVLDVWAIVKIVQSGAGTGKKVLWIVLVLLFPIIGFLLWFFLGPKR